jgi:hypothetical protein
VPAKWLKAGVLEDGVVTVSKAYEIEGLRFAEPALVAAVRRLASELDQAGNHQTLHAPSEPASKKRQGTKSREIGHSLAASAMESVISNG